MSAARDNHKTTSVIFPCRFVDKKNRVIEVRLYDESEYEALEDMYDTFEPKRAAHGLPPRRDWVRRRWLKDILGRGHHILAWANENLAAHAVFFEMDTKDRAEWGIFVHQDYQNAGIGRMLTRIGKVWAAELDFSNAWLVVESFNERARRVFKKSGFLTHKRMDAELDMSMEIEGEVKQLVKGDFARPDAAEFVRLVAERMVLNASIKGDFVLIHTDFSTEQPVAQELKPIFDRYSLAASLVEKQEGFSSGAIAVCEPSPVDFRIASFWHDPDYLLHLHLAGLGISNDRIEGYGLSSASGPFFHGIDRFSLLSCGGSLLAARLIAETSVKIAFNPCGGFHHAGRDRAADFCFINDTVMSILYLAGLGKRVFLLDLDADHGDAVQALFENDERVFCCSVYAAAEGEAPVAPEKVFRYGQSAIGHIDVPVTAGTGDDEYLKIFENIVPAIAKDFKPDVTVAHVGVNILSPEESPRLNINTGIYKEVVSRALALAPKTLVLGGCGRTPDCISRGWAAVWNAIVSRGK